MIQCDNLKTGVVKHGKDEVELNRSYQELAEHYNTAVVPARVRTPKDKAFVEGTVGVLDDALVLRGLFSKLCNEDKLTRKAVLALIDAVYVYDLNRIEVAFQYENEIQKLMRSVESEK